MAVTSTQLLSFVVIALMMGAFIWGRFRYDVVAATSLLLSIVVGVVPFDRAFSGFSDDIVIIVGSALVVSYGVARSGVMEYAVQRYAPRVASPRAQLALLVIVVTLLSAFVKNLEPSEPSGLMFWPTYSHTFTSAQWSSAAQRIRKPKPWCSGVQSS